MEQYDVTLSPEANNQLKELLQYIARSASLITAKRYTDAVLDYCYSLETFPDRGQIRDDLHPGLRITHYRKRTAIAFKVTDTTVRIIGIYHGGRNYEDTLPEELSESAKS